MKRTTSVSLTGAPHLEVMFRYLSSIGIILAKRPMMVPAKDATRTARLKIEVVLAKLIKHENSKTLEARNQSSGQSKRATHLRMVKALRVRSKRMPRPASLIWLNEL